MDKNFFNKTDTQRKILLSIVVILMISSGIFGLYMQKESNSKTRFYSDSIESAKNIQIRFQSQIQMWKNILLNQEHASAYRKYYYQFSKYSTEIQDEMFNLKIRLAGYETIGIKINDAREFHSKLSEKYISLMSDMESQGKQGEIDPASIMREQEARAIEQIDTIVNDISTLADREISKVSDRYFLISAVSLVAIGIISSILLVQIMLDTKKSQENIIQIARRLNRYLPPQLVNSILRNELAEESVTSKKHLTVCFTDLQGFTSITEKQSPETTARILNEYFSDMTTIVHAWGGMIDKFMGDGIMVIFGAFDDSAYSELASNCVNMAKAMLLHTRSLMKKWESEGIEYPLNLRIGINSGIATVGTFGPPERQSFTAIGSVVNIASRLEHICPVNAILISSSTKKLTGDEFDTDAVEESVKGIPGLLRFYRITV